MGLALNTCLKGLEAVGSLIKGQTKGHGFCQLTSDMIKRLNFNSSSINFSFISPVKRLSTISIAAGKKAGRPLFGLALIKHRIRLAAILPAILVSKILPRMNFWTQDEKKKKKTVIYTFLQKNTTLLIDFKNAFYFKLQKKDIGHYQFVPCRI